MKGKTQRGTTPPPPGLRGGGRAPQADVPFGVAPPGLRVGKGKPEAFIAYRAPMQARGDLGMIGVCLLILGVRTMADPMTTGGFVLGLVFALAGALVGAAWIRVWLLHRRAWGLRGRWL